MEFVGFKVSNHLSTSLRRSLPHFFLPPRCGHGILLCLNPPLHLFSANSRLSISNTHRIFSSASDLNTPMDMLTSVKTHASAACNNVAIKVEEMSYSYNQLISSAFEISSLLLNETSRTTVKALKSEKPQLNGTRIGIVAKPSAEFVAGILGTWLSGGVAVPLALSHPEAELLHVINDSDVSMLLSTEDYGVLMQNVAIKSAAQYHLIPPVPSITFQTSTADLSLSRKNTSENAWQEYIENLQTEGDNPAIIIYTSGTTGKPKGVVHTHKSVTAQVQMLTEAWEYRSSDHFLHSLPLHHVHGLFNALLAPIYAGSTVEFLQKFSVRGIWQRWRECYPKDGTKADSAITVFTGVPTMYSRLIQGYEAMDLELQEASASAARQLRLMMCGSSALPFPVMQQWEAITGHRLLERYGMTEFVMAISNPLKGLRKGGTVGKPFPGVQAMILVGDEDGTDASNVGELCIRSPSLFKEYWKLPEVTKESFVNDGFFKTGDAVKVDEDGYYVILGRTSADIMKVGGYKLSALEIEAILLEHPSVSECCVLGLADKDYGEAVCAIIVPDSNVKKTRGEELKPAISLGELCSWAKDKLAPYKLPTRLLLWDSLPRNAMGKVNKKELKKQIAS